MPRAIRSSNRNNTPRVKTRTLLNAFITWENASQNLEPYALRQEPDGRNLAVVGQAVATLWNFTHHGPPRELGIVGQVPFLEIGYIKKAGESRLF